MDIDDSNFIYTLTGLTDSIWDVGTGQIRRLNPAGNNILKDKNGNNSDTLNFADESDYRDDSDHPIMTSFNKLCVDSDGFIYAVDIIMIRGPIKTSLQILFRLQIRVFCGIKVKATADTKKPFIIQNCWK
jgi:hypothetical protein